MDVRVTWAPFDYSLLGMQHLFIYFSQLLTYLFFLGGGGRITFFHLKLYHFTITPKLKKKKIL